MSKRLRCLASISRVKSSVPGRSTAASSSSTTSTCLQRRQLGANLRHLAPVERRRGHQDRAGAKIHAGSDRLRTEGREQRRNDGPVLEAAEHRHIEFRDAPGEHEQALALPDAELTQDVGEAVGQAGKLAERDIARLATAQEAEGDTVAQLALCMALDRLMGDVQATRGQAFQPVPGRVPGKTRTLRRIIGQIGRRRSSPALLRMMFGRSMSLPLL